jgi:hypothetical protein
MQSPEFATYLWFRYSKRARAIEREREMPKNNTKYEIKIEKNGVVSYLSSYKL